MVQWEILTHRVANALDNRKDYNFAMICLWTCQVYQEFEPPYSITATKLDKWFECLHLKRYNLQYLLQLYTLDHIFFV